MKTLCDWMDKACTRYNTCGGGYSYEVCNFNSKFKPLPSALYRNHTTLRFRNREFMAVADYDTFLRSRFGQDYMLTLPPEEKRQPSHCRNILIER